MTKSKKFKYLSVVIFDPPYAKKQPKAYDGHILKIGEDVLYLGEIPNAPGHCAVARHSGEIVWLVHPEEFRLAKDDEL